MSVRILKNLIEIGGEGTEITGDIEAKSSIRVAGRVTGNINSKRGYVHITRSCYVTGDIKGDVIFIDGTVMGNVTANNVYLRPMGQLEGNIVTKIVGMDAGCRFDGKCTIMSKSDTAAQITN